VGDEALLHIETQFGEQLGFRLYGFLTREERRAFTLLQDIQGVGPKAALAVLDVLPPAELAAAAAREDKAAVARANGVGPKLAARIVSELKGKPLGGDVIVGHAPVAAAPPQPSAVGEAVAALMGLGVAEVNARRVVEHAALKIGDEAEVSALIKAGLQELGR
jgi:Holliday junction DNA helicase RuvA